MKKPALLFLLLLAAARAQAAGLYAQFVVPLSANLGGVFTLVLQVQNQGALAANAVTPSALSSAGTALVSQLSGPMPASANLAPNQIQNFTFTFSALGCGNLAFSGAASGTDTIGPVGSNSASGPYLDVSCTPVPTPPPTSTPLLQGSARIFQNKFHPAAGEKAVLNYSLPYDGTLRITIYNRLGTKVKSIAHEGAAGAYSEEWDGRSDQGQLSSSGIYLAHFQAKGLNKVEKLVLIK